MNSRGGIGRAVIDLPLIDELLARRLDPVHVLQGGKPSGELHGIEPGSLRRVRENVGYASDSPLAARAGFQLGIELPDPAHSPEEPDGAAGTCGAIECDDESPSADQLDFQIAVFMGRLFIGRRLTARTDGAWCEQFGVSIEAVAKVRDTCGRFLDPEAAAGTAFEVAIEARAAVRTWGTAS